MSLFVVIKDLDVLRLELGCEVSRQGTLTLDGCLHLSAAGRVILDWAVAVVMGSS